MPISGPVVHQQLMDAYATTQSQLKTQRGQIGQTSNQSEQLDHQRGDALVKLAEHYLPELTPTAIRETWVEVQPGISQVFRRKEAECNRLRSGIDDLTQKRDVQDAALVELNRQLDDARNAQNELSDEVEKQLRDDDAFVQLSDRAAVAEAELERAEANLHEIEQDAAKKLPAYSQSTLFNYLRERDYGTSAYLHRGFTRRMDRWVAKMVDYNKAKQGYDFLRKTPEQMREIIADDRDALSVVMDELERQRDQVAEQLGLPAKIQATGEWESKRTAQLSLLADMQSQIDALQSQLTDADDARGSYYREAIGLFRDMLTQIDSRDLQRRAKSTLDLSDDQIVAQLIGVEAKIGELSDAAIASQKRVARTQRFLEDLGRVIQQFRAAEFDSSRSQFLGTLDLQGTLFRAYEAGDADIVWQEIRNAQRWGPTVGEQITRVATHPMTQVLINAMAHAAGAALQQQARNAGRRHSQRDRSRGGSWSGGNSSWGSGDGFRW